MAFSITFSFLYERSMGLGVRRGRARSEAPAWTSLLVASLLALMSQPLAAQTQDAPRLIGVTTLQQLNAIRWDLNGDGVADSQDNAANYAAAFATTCTAASCTGYELLNNLDFNTGSAGTRSDDLYWNDGAGWRPIGTESDNFVADFDGRSNVIQNLFINRPTEDYVGLFGYFGFKYSDDHTAADTPFIRNVGIVDADVSGRNQVGALTGSISTGTVVTSYVTGGSVSGTSEVGGLVGALENSSSARIKAGYARVRVRGGSSAGGLVGKNDSTIAEKIIASYAAGPVTGTTMVGGLVGQSATVSGGDNYKDSYWDTEASGQAESAGTGAIGTDTATLQAPTAYTGIYANWNVDISGDGNADDPWRFGTSSEYPFLRVSDVGNYDTDGDTLIEVATTTQLEVIRHDLGGIGLAGVSGDANRAAYLAAFPLFDERRTCPTTCTGYELSNDLDLSGIPNWTPIGGGLTQAPWGNPPLNRRYQAVFEGNGHVISNITIRSANNAADRFDNVGFFGAVGVTGRIRNLGLNNVHTDLAGSSLGAGALVGYNAGKVAACYVVGDSRQVRGGWALGALVGRLDGGVVIASYADVRVHQWPPGQSVGGLIGGVANGGIVSASYSVSRPDRAYGLQGSPSGGLVGDYNAGTIQTSYFDEGRSGQSACCGSNKPTPDNTPRTSDQLRVPTMAAGTIYEGWDRLNVDDTSSTVMGVLTLNDDSPWDFGTFYQYPVLVFGGSTDTRQARRTLQQETQPEVSLAVTFTGSATVSKGEAATYVVRLPGVLPAGVSASWSWSVGGTGIDAADFAGTSRGSVVIAPGGSSESFSLRVRDDDVTESSKVMVVTLSNAKITGTTPARVSLSVPVSVMTTIEASSRIGYDVDGDTLIEVATTSQLAAIRYDLGGVGLAGVSDANRVAYLAAFPSFGRRQTCPSTCTGYELSADLDLSSVEPHPGPGWTPIGGGVEFQDFPGDYYTAVFEGNGHVISNLRVARDEGWNQTYQTGMFGAVSASGTIRNVGLRNARVEVAAFAPGQSPFVGALVGDNQGKVAASYVIGGRISSGYAVGGLIGKNAGRVVASYADVAVHAFSTVGGLVGQAEAASVVSASYSVGRVTGIFSPIGGLIGSRGAGDVVESSYFDSGRSGQSGCCAPKTSGQLRVPTTAAGTIYAGWDKLNVDRVDQGRDGNLNDDAPWDFGSAFDYPVLVFGGATETRAARRLSQQEALAPLAPTLAGSETVSEGGTASYVVRLPMVLPTGASARWDWVVGGDEVDADDFAGTTGASVVIEAGASSASFSLMVRADTMPEGLSTMVVTLRNARLTGAPARVRLGVPVSVRTTIEASSGLDYDDDGDTLIDVETTSQLAAIRYDLGGAGLAGVSSANRTAYLAAFPSFDERRTCPSTCTGYELSADLDLSGVEPAPGPGWTPIGGGGEVLLDDDYYTAVFEGNGHVISNLRVARSGQEYYMGLFGAVGADGRIRNVGLRNAQVSAGSDSQAVGALVGINGGQVAASYVSGGRISGKTYVGGLIGIHNGGLVASYADVEVHADASNAGGLIGAAGLVSVVSASYSVGRTTGGSPPTGGLIGNMAAGAVVQSSYFDAGRSGQDRCCGFNAPDPDRTSKTSSELRTPTTAAGTIYAGWDKLNVDRMDQGRDGDLNDDSPWDFGSVFDYPVLVFGGATETRAARRLSQQGVLAVLAPTLTGSETVSEGGTASYVVRLPMALPPGASARWDWSVGGGEVGVADFVGATTGSVAIASGAVSASFSVGVRDDDGPELSEVMVVALSNARLTGAPAHVSLGVPVSVMTTIEAGGEIERDYDTDNDTLIEVTTPSQLSAIRYDLGGAGLAGVSSANRAAYLVAFPSFSDGQTCPSVCTGYELSNDLDLSGVNPAPGPGWTPIGGGYSPASPAWTGLWNQYPTSIRYEGVFEGNGHVIRNMKITRSGGRYDYVGLFGTLGSAGVIRSVGMENVNVNAPNSEGTAALVGVSYGKIAASYAVGGTVRGSWDVGGLVGEMKGGIVIAGYSDVAVHGGGQRAGGLIGTGEGSSVVSASYTVGIPTGGGSHRGGLIGHRGSTVKIQSGYFDSERSGESSCCGGAGAPSPDETPQTPAGLRTPTAAVGIYAGWDRLNVDDTTGTVMGMETLNDDSPWDFGSVFDYPVLVFGGATDTESARRTLQQEAQPEISLAVTFTGSATVSEGGTASYVVRLPMALPPGVSARWSWAAGGGEVGVADFVGATTGNVAIASGAVSASFSVRVRDDDEPELSEVLVVTLTGARLTGAPAHVSLGVPASVRTTIEASGAIDYDFDNDTLIEVATTSQLAAIRYDLGGAGLAGVSSANRDDYLAAFPAFGMEQTCPSTCTGYELSADLDLSSVEPAPGPGWTPLGGGVGVLLDDDYYTAVFEGNGHVISNMQVARDGQLSHTGLFGAVSATGTIRNVGLRNARVSVDADHSTFIGALVGLNKGEVVASYVSGGRISGVWGVGGLIGVNYGRLVACYADVEVHADGGTVGGLVGEVRAPSVVSASYSVGKPTGDDAGGLMGQFVGGVVESSYFDVERSLQASCCATDPQNLDNVAPRMSSELHVPTTTAGTIYAGWDKLDVDGVDQGDDGDLNDDSPWDFGSVFDYPVLVFGGATDTEATRRTSQQETQPEVSLAVTFTGSATVSEGGTASYVVRLPGALPAGVSASWSWAVGGGEVGDDDFVGTTAGSVVIASGAVSASFSVRVRDDLVTELAEVLVVTLTGAKITGAPARVSLGVPVSVRTTIEASGKIDYDVDDDNLIEVTTMFQLSAIRYDLGGVGLAGVSSANEADYLAAFPLYDVVQTCPSTCTGYELSADLDLPSDQNWDPIGDDANRYQAVFEGNGHVIRNMEIRAPDNGNYHYRGLFGSLGAGGTIRNVGLTDVHIEVKGDSFQTGALAGASRGKIAASYVAGGLVNGVWRVGGLVGTLYTSATMIASYTDVEVRARNEDNRGNAAGGLIGTAESGSIVSASYALGMTTAVENQDGGLIGERDSQARIQKSYFDTGRTGQSDCCGQNTRQSDSGTGRTSAQLRAPSSATGIYAGWDQLNVDGVDQKSDNDLNDDGPWDFGTGFDYPVLRGVSARYLDGNTTAIRAQRRRQPPVFATLSQRTSGTIAEGSAVEYAVELDVRGAIPVTLSWSVERTGVGTGHADAADFPTTTGMITLVNTDSAVFRITVGDDDVPEATETFRVRLSNPRGFDRLRLSVASSSVVSSIAFSGANYDADGDNLIDVATTSQLSAIRYDLGGVGLAGVSSANEADYLAAFELFDEAKTCPSTCTGYELSADLDLSGADWTPIGGATRMSRVGPGNSNTPPLDGRYQGGFEGNGHVIRNMRIRSPSQNWHYVGLFGALGEAGWVRGVGLRDVVVDVQGGYGGSIGAGALVGHSYGRVAASYVSGGSVSGGWEVGGLTGANGGTLIASYADVLVAATDRSLGGLVGSLSGSGVVSASYSVSRVVRGDDSRTVGGLVGGRSGSSVLSASYFDSERSGEGGCCGERRPSMDDAPKTSNELRTPTTATGTIYMGWDQLNVDGVDQNGDNDLNDDSPWDFGTSFDYPVLRRVSARYPDGNTTAIRAQQRRQPPVLVTLSRPIGGALAEDSTAVYTVELGNRSADPVTMSWSVELTGVGPGHAEAADFSGATRGQVVLINTDSMVFRVRIIEDGTPERAEKFRVRLSNLLAPDNLRLSATGSAVVSVIASHGMNYDTDGNNLIDVKTTTQLSAIRYDLRGAGLAGVDGGDLAAAAYQDAFPFFDEDETCPGGCRGYELLNDVDLPRVATGTNWEPIGDGTNHYQAIFEGNGHVISNMEIRAPDNGDYHHRGLFGALGAGGTIRNVGLSDVHMELRGASSQTGALAGASRGKIAASYVVGGLVHGAWRVGGLVGTLHTSATMIASYTDVGVRARNENDEGNSAGGLVGVAESGSIVSASYALGRTTAVGGQDGGLIGERDSQARIQKSYFDTGRTGQSDCCGQNTQQSDSGTGRTSAQLRTPTTASGIYAGWDKLNVDGVDQGGGDDLNDDSPWDFGTGFDYPVLRGVSARYTDGNTTATRMQRQSQPPVLATLSQRGHKVVVEGFAATYAVELDGHSDDVVTMSWSVELTGDGDGHADAADFDGATSGEVVLVNTDSAVFRVEIAGDATLEPRETFRVRLNNVQGPDNLRLSTVSSAVVSTIASSGGMDYDANGDGLIEVRTTTQLEAIRHDLRGEGRFGVDDGDLADYDLAFPSFDESATCPNTCRGYELLNDIDLSSVPNWAEKQIGGGYSQAFPAWDGWNRYPESLHYNAVFEGHGHVIRNMNLTRSGARFDYVGLFGILGADGVIRSVGMENVNVSATNSVGVAALAGYSFGKIAASYVVSGSVSGSWAVGGLVGEMRGGIVIAGYSNVAVHGGGERAGGLIGSDAGNSVVSASYTIGKPTGGGPHRGGLTGYRVSMEIQSSYFDLERSGESSCCGHNPQSPDNSPKTSAELRTPVAADGIYAGWDKLNVDDTSSTVMGVLTLNDDNPWDFGTNLDYPVLRGISARYPKGNTTGVLAQRPTTDVLVTLSQDEGRKLEGEAAEYAVTLGAYGAGAVTMSWSVELTGTGLGHADALDFDGATSGEVVLAGTDSAVFSITIEDDDVSEPRETFRVRLSNPRGLEGLRLSVASSAVVSTIASSGGMDYDANDDGLIEVRTTTQLAAIHYDLRGEGRLGVDDEDLADYDLAFPSFDESATCPNTCKGYELLNDVDLSSVRNWTPIGGGITQGSPGWSSWQQRPLHISYGAVFEGNGHVIRNMRIRRDGERDDYMGLFSILSSTGVIRNVGMEGVNVSASPSVWVGALAGYNFGKIAASYAVNGSVRGFWATGGLVGGVGGGIVIASYSAVSAHGVAGAQRVGGLIGNDDGGGSIVSASYTIGVPSGGDPHRGGLLGYRQLFQEQPSLVIPLEIQSSYFDGKRSGESSCCGHNPPPTDRDTRKTSAELRTPIAADDFYTGWDKLDVDGVDQGGDDDLNDDSPWDFGTSFDYPVLRGVSARYLDGNTTAIRAQRRGQPPVFATLSQRTTGTIAEDSAMEYVVALDGHGATPVTLSWSVELTGDGDGHADALDFDGATSGEVVLVNTDSAVFRVAIAGDEALEPRETFRVRLSNPRGLERLRLSVASSAVVSAIERSDGIDYDDDGDNLIEVATTSQLAAIRYDLDGNGMPDAQAYVTTYTAAFPRADLDMGCAATCKGYELSNDVDLSSVENWTPIGGGYSPASPGWTGQWNQYPESIRYNGVFEGNGHVIRNMKITRTGSRYDYVGLFGTLGNAGVIRSVGMENVNVDASASEGTAALAGVSYGKIAASYAVSGTVKGSWDVGGLVGEMKGGIVIASYSDVAVNGVGERAGGLIGTGEGSSVVSASYTVGIPTGGGSHRGGLIGHRGSTVKIQSGYFDSERSGESSCCGGAGAPSPDETPQTSAGLRTPTTAVGIYAGWDRLNVDDTTGTVMGVLTLNDDSPWDFGSSLQYPVLHGQGERYPAGNTTAIRVQRQRQPPVLATLSQRGRKVVMEGFAATYAVELGGRAAEPVTMSWSVELTGGGDGHADAFDFDGATSGEMVLVNTDSAVFRVEIAGDATLEPRETFRVRLSNLQGPDNLYLSTVSSAVVSAIASSGGMDYDANNDGLIEVRTTTQLSVIRHDLRGEGRLGVDDGDLADYDLAFPSFDESATCPNTCKGYELSNDIDLSSVPNWAEKQIGGGYAQALSVWDGWNRQPESLHYNAVFEGHGHVIRNMNLTRSGARSDYVGLFGILGADGVIRSVGMQNVNVSAPSSVGVGALVGYSFGKIAASYVAGGSVSGSWAVGGLVGEMRGGIVIAGYSNVAVHGGGERAGGLIGSDTGSSVVSASYTIGKPTGGGPHRGGLIGYRTSMEIQSSYFDVERSGESSCCGHNPQSPDNSPKTSYDLRIPTMADGIYAGWDKLNVDDTTGTVMGIETLNDDNPWDFGTAFDYPVLKGVSDFFPSGNTTEIRAQRESQPAVKAALAGSAMVSEGARATYTVGLPGALPSGVTASWNWNVDTSGGTSGLDDFAGATSGNVSITAGHSSQSFEVAIKDDDEAELAETFSVELTNAMLSGAAGALRLSTEASAAMTTIGKNDPLQVTVAVAPAVVAEGATATFTVALGGGADRAVTVEYELTTASEGLTAGDLGQVLVIDRGAAGDAVGVDMLPVTGSITLRADGSARVQVSVSVDEVEKESSEQFRLRLTNCPNCGSDHPAEIGEPSSAEARIRSERGLVVAAGVYLEGAYDVDRGNVMRTDLIGVLPRQQPYGVAPWNYPVTTTVPHVDAEFGGLGSVTSTIVDWVLMELRTSAPGAGADAVQPTTGGRAAGLLLSDGRIAGINEEATTAAEALSLAGVRFESESLEGEDVYVLIHHRNHLPVMSAQPTTSTGCEADYCVDFRSQQSYGRCAQFRRSDRVYVMYAGDTNASGSIGVADLSSISNNQGLQVGTYELAVDDMNFTGSVGVVDLSFGSDNSALNSAFCNVDPTR